MSLNDAEGLFETEEDAVLAAFWVQIWFLQRVVLLGLARHYAGRVQSSQDEDDSLLKD